MVQGTLISGLTSLSLVSLVHRCSCVQAGTTRIDGALTISGGRDFASSFLPWEVSSKSSCAVQSATLRTTIVTRAGIAIVDNTGGPEQGVLPAPEIGTEDRASIGRAAGPSPHPARIDLPLIFVSVLRIRSDSKAFTATSSQR